jgi:hypothetical protein
MSNILRLDGDAAAIQALVSGQATAVGGNMFYVDRLNEAKPGLHGNKFEFGWSGGARGWRRFTPKAQPQQACSGGHWQARPCRDRK